VKTHDPSSAPRALAAAALALVALAAAAPARAQHAHGGDIQVASTADGSGALALEYDFEKPIPVAFDSETIPGTSLHTATSPGFAGLEEDAPDEGLFALDPGTQVRVEITAVEAGRTAILLNSVLLDQAGESVVLGTAGAAPPNDLHHHGTMQLILMLPPGTYGSGRISLRVTTTSPSYAASQSYTLLLSNAHLASIDYDGAALDRPGLKCQQAIGKEDKKLVARIFGEIVKCLDKANLVEALEAAGDDAASAEAAAQRACGAAMMQRIDGFVARSRAGLERACVATSPAYFQATDLAAHLDLVRCRAGEIAAAAYGGAQGLIAEQGGSAIAADVACSGATGP
jgi:hypothetical protein